MGKNQAPEQHDGLAWLALPELPREIDTEPRGPQGQTPRTQSGPGRPGGQAEPGTGGRPGPAPRPPVPSLRWGTRPGRLGVFAVIGATLLGMVITVLSGSEPGVILGIFLVVGTVGAAFAVRPGAVYQIFPVPAPAYAVAAIIAGLIHDRGVDTSNTALALSGAQWIANGFVPMIVATGAAVLIAGYRWLREGRPPDGSAAGRPGPPR
jgi:hypothetical protein